MSGPNLSRHDSDISWMQEAACQGEPVEHFFPSGDSPALYELGRLVCRDCPVRKDCLEYALRERLDDGLWGGLTVDERRRIRRDRRRDARRAS